MKTAIWIIAICEVIRVVQNMVQVMATDDDGVLMKRIELKGE